MPLIHIAQQTFMFHLTDIIILTYTCKQSIGRGGVYGPQTYFQLNICRYPRVEFLTVITSGGATEGAPRVK